MFTTIFRRPRTVYSVICGGILPKFDLIKALIHVLFTCKNEEDPIKNESAGVFTKFLPLKVYGDFSRPQRAANSAVHGWIWSNFELVRDFMVDLVTCKKVEKDPIENVGARVFTTLYINFSDAQGQINLELVVVSGQNINSLTFSPI